MNEGAYSLAFSSSRRGRIALERSSFTRRQSEPIAIDLLLSLVLAKSLLALSYHIAKEWLLNRGLSTLALTSSILIVASPAKLALQRPWAASKGRSVAGPPIVSYAFLLLGEQMTLIYALYGLPALRVIMLSQFANHWGQGSQAKSSVASRNAINAALASSAVLGFCSLLDAVLSGGRPAFLSYAALGAHIVLSGQRGDLVRMFSIEEAPLAKMQSIGTALSASMSVPIGMIGLASASNNAIAMDPSKSEITFLSSLPLLFLLASSISLFDPFVEQAVLSRSPVSRLVASGWPIAVASSIFVGFVAFNLTPGRADLIIGVLTYVAQWQFLIPNSYFFSIGDGLTARSSPGLFERAISFLSQSRRTIRIILANTESRRIYYFLCLNLTYMFIQLLYGFWTNSLGLISDSIHMFFDCIALAMGLLASVMATWPSDATYTYGYGRVETLSGFANGVFLILISVFIMFEAAQRLLDPPEMNTNQLLVVSTLGLAVNLVGMFATGHHHHGHGHSHGHDHGAHGHMHVHEHHHYAHGVRNDLQSHSHHGVHDARNILASSWKCAKPTGQKHDCSVHDSHSHEVTLRSGHDADHSGGHTSISKGHSHNMRGVFLHVMADTLGSVGVIISTLLINRYGWTGFDPLASIFIAVLIFASVIPLIQDSAALLTLDLGEERERQVRKALHDLGSVDGLAAFAAPRFWPRDADNVVGSIHIQVSTSLHQPGHLADLQEVVRHVESVLRKGITNLSAVTVQVEAKT